MIVWLDLAALTPCGSVAGAQVRSNSVARPAASIARHAAAPAADSTAAARQFLQKFYDWYAPFAQTDPRFPAWWAILTRDSADLDAHLARALRADSAAQRMNPRSREVIDFDPFLNSQDPCPRYTVTDVRPDGRGYRATVEPVCPNPTAQYWQTLDKHTSVKVIPQGGHWRIANVFYGPGDLESERCGHAKADRRPDRRPIKC